MEKVRVGFVGVGGIANTHLNNISNHADAEIVAVCDISEDTATRQAEKYKTTAYTDFDQMLENEKIDALFICVPPFAHGDIEEKAAKKGVHLLVEKPIELDFQKAKTKGEIITQSGVINASGYCLRYLDTVQIGKNYLEDKQFAMVRGYYITSFVPTPWYRIKNKSGGQLVEQSTHILDLMGYLCGDIQQIQADMSLQVMSDIEGLDIPDVTSVNVRFKTGAVGHLDSSLIQHDHRMGLEILGRDFRLALDGTTLSIFEKDKMITYGSKVDFYEEQDNAFIKAIQTKNQDLILASYHDGLETLSKSLAANISNEKRSMVTMEEFYKNQG
ncbi:Gfo/Idh/MocA family oxidoreductase [Lederbergia sp. NSJ-179]|uniref:Gfo/Idh/MocA family protein n=1 Tax=Lederbergia sp. NSJ-179 TaxID=2931402 RepID=UPI001FD5A4D3|nr:Gfo/Idh/MocA family oxidoreductase [Lederbergia sp. NSJ-179]MCJ7841271.1 Gfo/Idh/MocA family oxidoreductase [Lederbergia sp. NSJ-179]